MGWDCPHSDHCRGCGRHEVGMQELLVLLPGSSSGGQTALPGGNSCLGLSAPCLPLYLLQPSQWQLSSLPSSGGTFPRKAGEPDPLLGQQRCSMMTSFTKPLEQLLCMSPFILYSRDDSGDPSSLDVSPRWLCSRWEQVWSSCVVQVCKAEGRLGLVPPSSRWRAHPEPQGQRQAEHIKSRGRCC